MTMAMNTEKKRALGRGLSALLPQVGAVPTSDDGSARGVLRIPIEEIRRDVAQPRKAFRDEPLQELAESIRSQGLLQPVLVRRDGRGFRLIAGERRWRAAQLAGLREIPAIVREATEAQAFEMALVENLQREDLNPVEEALGYRRLMDESGLTQDAVAGRVGKDRSTVANALRLLALPDEVKSMLSGGELDMGHARALLGLPRAADMLALSRAIVAEGLSVRETEWRVKQARPAVAGKKREARASAQVRALTEDLQRRLGTKVKVHDRGGSGTFEIAYFSYEDLERILTLIRK